MITYFYREKVEHNDLLNRTVLVILKYSIFCLCLFGGLALASNYNTVENYYPPIRYANMWIVDFRIWTGPQIIIYTGCVFLILFLLFDAVFRREGHNKFVQKVTSEESNFFKRLSNIERKRWICEEHYRRENLGIRLLSDEQLDQLKKTVGRSFNLN